MYENNDILQKFEFNQKVSQINNNINYQLGLSYNVKILIITERLFGCAEGLWQYLKCYSDIEVFRTYQLSEIDNIQIIPDIIIVVGYLNIKDTYIKINNLRNTNRYMQSILYGCIDSVIFYERSFYHIDEVFDRRLPVAQFVDFIREKIKMLLEKKRAEDENITAIHEQLSILPMCMVNVLIFLYVYNFSMAEIACLMNISIRKLYVIKDKVLEILDTMQLCKNDAILKTAIRRYQSEIKPSFYVKQNWNSSYICKIKLLVYKLYEKILSLDKDLK